ncbi:hypothetical protein WP1_227 [Pseudomonas phage WP1]
MPTLLPELVIDWNFWLPQRLDGVKIPARPVEDIKSCEDSPFTFSGRKPGGEWVSFMRELEEYYSTQDAFK